MKSPASFFEEGLKLISFCPLCQAKQNAMEAKVIEQSGESHLIHMHCIQCQMAILALVTVTPAGLSSVGMVTDLSEADARQFRLAEPVDVDETMELYALVKDRTRLQRALTEPGGLV